MGLNLIWKDTSFNKTGINGGPTRFIPRRDRNQSIQFGIHKKELTFEKLMKVNWTEFEPVASFYASIAPMKISQRFGSAGLSEFSVYHA